VTATPSTYFALHHDWKTGDEVSVEMPLTLHIATTPDDKQVQAAMYGPLVLAARLGTEGLTTSMIYGGSGPKAYDEGYPLPTVDTRPVHRGAVASDSSAPETAKAEDEIWFEQKEGSPLYPLEFRTKGHGPIHTLVPLNQVMDERYSVYLRNIGIA
jgi:hypothetical protein